MGKIAFLFPGQGAQFVGMGRELLGSSEIARDLFARASQILGYDLAELCLQGPEERLNSTDISQPALYVTSLAALEQFRADSPEVVSAVSASAGLSLGEYTALAFAGAVSFEDGLRTVRTRGEAMQSAADKVSSGMVSILGMDREQVESLCDEARQEGEVLQVANLLCPGNIAVSGSRAACERIATLAVEKGAMKAIPLAVAGAFHTPIMETAVERLRGALSEVALEPAKMTFISNVDASPHESPEEIRDLLIRQVVSPVRWEDSMRYLLDLGYDTFYEVGPGRVLRGLMKRINRKITCHGVMG